MKTSFYQETLQKILGKDIKIHLDSKQEYTEFKIIKIDIDNIIIFSIKVASVMGSFKCVPKQAH